MRIRSFLAVILLLFPLFTLLGDDAGTQYRSNILGMKLEELVGEEPSEWILTENGTVQQLFHQENLYWEQIETAVEGGRRVKRTFESGRTEERIYRGSLLVKERILQDADTLESVEYSYFSQTLLEKNTYSAGVLSNRETYVRNNDGTLHLRQKVTFSSDGAASGTEILLLESGREGKMLVGRYGDFSLIQSYPNGLILTERWISGAHTSEGRNVESYAGGELIVSEKRSDGTEQVIHYDAEGSITKKIETKNSRTVTTSYQYNDDGSLSEEKRESQDDLIQLLYSYAESGTRKTVTEYRNGTISRIRTTTKEGVTEEVYRNAKPYLIVNYEPDGVTVRDSLLAE